VNRKSLLPIRHKFDGALKIGDPCGLLSKPKIGKRQRSAFLLSELLGKTGYQVEREDLACKTLELGNPSQSVEMIVAQKGKVFPH
jgi:hypothetical protein